MLNTYRQSLKSLGQHEVKLLSTQLQTLRRALRPGFSRLNWNSLGIIDFISRCSTEIGKFNGLLGQIRKNSSAIEAVIDQIASANLIKHHSHHKQKSTAEVLDASEFIDSLNKHRNEAVESLVQKYKSIGPLLIKIESLVVNTNTGKSPSMKSYYAYWEKEVFFGIYHVSMQLC